MSAMIEALYIFDDKGCILEHIYTSRPPPAKDLFAHFRKHAPPRPAVLHIADLNPPTNVYSISHGHLVLLCTSSKDVPPQGVIDFLRRFVDILEDFLGNPLISTKVEENYEVIGQLLVETCDGGIISNTEGNALKEAVEVSSALGKLFTQVGLPSASASAGPTNLAATLKAASSAANGPAIPWRKSNVRHTSNELYVDIVESLSVVTTPSGRPISARASGSMVFTSKISGIPDLLLTLTAPGGTSTSPSTGLLRTMQLPSFHPCIRLSHWHSHPGSLSFVPPDGKFMLASYESDLLPTPLNTATPPSRESSRLFLPCTPDLRTSLGRNGTDFEARLTLNNSFPGAPAPSKPSSSSRIGSSGPSFPFSRETNPSSATPTLEGVSVSIPFPADVRSVTELKPSRGEVSYNSFTKTVEWRIPTKDGFSVTGVATLTGSVSGPFSADDEDALSGQAGDKTRALGEYYDDDTLGVTEGATNGARSSEKSNGGNKALMPRSINVSFAVKGWLASGIKVESLVVDVKRSKGLGDGVRPYKGVKYLTVSKHGVERRVE